jgi:hypothetical protein
MVAMNYTIGKHYEGSWEGMTRLKPGHFSLYMIPEYPDVGGWMELSPDESVSMRKRDGTWSGRFSRSRGAPAQISTARFLLACVIAPPAPGEWVGAGCGAQKQTFMLSARHSFINLPAQLPIDRLLLQLHRLTRSQFCCLSPGTGRTIA